jgi:type IV pilus assembly protein PilP
VKSWIAFMVIACVGVAGCSDGGGARSAKSATAPAAAAKVGPSTAAAPAAGAAAASAAAGSAAEAYAYDPAGKRDPFRSFVLETAKTQRTERGPLEQFDLSQLALVAVVWNVGNPRALVQDPSGRGYIVREGTPIGKNDGLVTRIDDAMLIVKESYVDYLGERTEKDIEMRVRQSQGG